jgi:hypothetical protein
VAKDNTLDQRHEREIAETLPGAKQTIASGAKYEKSDVVRIDKWGFLVECKCTQSLGFRVTRGLWKLARNRAYDRSVDLRPCLAIRFYGPTKLIETTKVEADLAVLDWEDFIEMVTLIDEQKAELDGLRRHIRTNVTEAQPE